MLEQQIDLINIDPSVPPHLPISDDAVEHAVQHHRVLSVTIAGHTQQKC